MTVDDVVYSFKSQANPVTGGNALSVFGGTLKPDGVEKLRRPSGSLQSRGAGRELRGRLLGRQLQHDRRPERLRLQQLPQARPGLRRDEQVHDARDSRPSPVAPSSATRTIGARRRSRTRSWPRSTPTSSRWRPPSRRARSTSWTSSPSPSARSCSTGTGTCIQMQVRPEPAALDALRPAPVHEQVRPPGDRLHPRPPGDHQGVVRRPRRDRQRQPVLPGSSRPTTRASASAA